MSEKRKKHKHHNKLILKKYSFEFSILFLILIGAFLLVENFELKLIVLQFGKFLFISFVNLLKSITYIISEFISTREGSDIIGMSLIFTAILLTYFRYRRMALTEWNSGKICPECELKMIRKRKELKYKILSKILFLRIRHYFCEKCKTSRLNFK
jgi:hypothetical protein